MHNLKKHFFWNTIGTTLWSFLSVFFLVVITRLNGEAASGDFSFAFGIASILWAIGTYGGRIYQVTDVEKMFLERDYIYSRLFTSMVMMGIAFFFALFTHYSSDVKLLVLLLTFFRVLDSISDAVYGLIQKEGFLDKVGVSLILKTILGFTLFVFIDYFSKNILLSVCCMNGLLLLLFLFFDVRFSMFLKKVTPKSWTWHFYPAKTVALLKVSFLVFLQYLLSMLVANSSRLFIEHYAQEKQGIFGILIMPITLVALLITLVIQPLTIPMATLVQEQGILGVKRILRKMFLFILGVAIVLEIGAYFMGTQALSLVFPLDFAPYREDLLLVVISGVLMAIASIFSTLFTILRKLKFIVLNLLITIGVLFTMSFLLVPHFSIRGALIAYLLACMASSLIYFMAYIREKTQT